MDPVTLAACHRGAVEALSLWLSPGVAAHVSGNSLTAWALDQSLALGPQVESVLRQLPRAGLREPFPELTDEQIERAALRVVVVVEQVLATVGTVAVAGESHRAVGRDVYGDHEVQIVVVHAAEGADDQGTGEARS